MMSEPPASVILEAELQARKSPCAKSKRGAVVFLEIDQSRALPARRRSTSDHLAVRADFHVHQIYSVTPVSAITITGVANRASLSVLTELTAEPTAFIRGRAPKRHRLPVESRTDNRPWMILDVGFIDDVWLYEALQAHTLYSDGTSDLNGPPFSVWRRYTAEEFHRTTLRNEGMEIWPR